MTSYRDRAGLAGQQWVKERPDVPTEAMVLLGRLAEAAQIISDRHTVPFLANYGLKAGEFDVLATLRRAGAPYTLSPTDLYAATMLSSGGMTNRIDRLVGMGLVSRAPNPDDRRSTMVALTEKGFALVDGIIAEHAAHKQELIETLNPSEREQLSALLAKLIRCVDPDSPDFL